jgi:hypothetical protein
VALHHHRWPGNSVVDVTTERLARKAGESLRGIAAATGFGLKTVQTIVAKRRQSAVKRRREFDKLRARDFRQRKLLVDRAPTQISNLGRDGEILIKRAKGL